MKITEERIPEMTLENFADKYGLEMVVRERQLPVGNPERFYANFRGAELRHGETFLCSAYGNGATQNEAIAAYAKKIEFKLLIVDAMKDTRQEIWVPRLKG